MGLREQVAARNPAQLFFDDILLGLETTGPARILTNEDFLGFSKLSGDAHPIHYDPDYAAETRFGRCVAHGLLLVGLTALGATPLSAQLHDSMVAFISQETRFIAPVFAGDELRSIHKVTDKSLIPGKKMGRVTFSANLMRGSDVALQGYQSYLIRSRPETTS